MSVHLRQSEVINLQIQIVTWLQKQILQQRTPTSETRELMSLLGQALQYYETLLSLEDRRFNGAPQENRPENPGKNLENTMVAASSPPEPIEPLPPTSPPSVHYEISDIDLEDFTELDEDISLALSGDREYFSLVHAYKQAVQAGCRLTESVFRDELRRGGSILGWRKEPNLGNRPSYYKEL